jgi:TPR repeat protein
LLGNFYNQGLGGVQQDHIKAIEIFTKSAELGCSKAHKNLAIVHHEGGNMKKAKFHFEAAAMAGHEGARCNLGVMEYNSGNIERAVKHWAIAASAGEYDAMHDLRICFEKRFCQ